MSAAQVHGLQSDAVRLLEICEGCPHHLLGQLGPNGLALGDL